MTEPLRTVQVTHRFRQSPQSVFDAWLDPATARLFLFATPTGEMIRAEIDARIGGVYCFTERRDGEDIDHTGRYQIIERPHHLAFTFAVPKFSIQETLVDIAIRGLDDGGCELVLTHSGVFANYAERNVEGWTMILHSLERTLGGA
jgi:uncharacterized protein YndB with AHSA1/START domain